MSIAVVTGSYGLVGSDAARYFAGLGMDVLGFDNGMRAQFFGKDGSTASNEEQLDAIRAYTHIDLDIRNAEKMDRVFTHFGKNISLVIHAAAQPSHDWAASDPATDWAINATATASLLETVRRHCPEAVFIFLSTNKVYGDVPNTCEYIECKTRWEKRRFARNGFDEKMRTDQSLHSLFGASKLAADILVQEYGRYFGMKTACFRCGCISGPNHAGVEAHGFLSYLMKCAVTGTPYTVYGYKGKQVRDNIHAADLVRAFKYFYDDPKCGEVYNMGGGRESNCSIREALTMAEQITSKTMDSRHPSEARRGDHIWWISDTSKFKSHYPGWGITRAVPDILKEIYDANAERWRR